MTPITENGIRVEEKGGRGRNGWSSPLLQAHFSACCADGVLYKVSAVNDVSYFDLPIAGQSRRPT